MAADNIPDPTITNQSPGHIHADVGYGGHQQITKVELGESAQKLAAWILPVATVMALSILVNIAMFVAYRSLTQTVDLDRYDDNTFINGRFAELSTQVKADHDLIQAYGLQHTLKER